MKILILCIMALVYHDTFSQNRAINWVFGDSAGINFASDTPFVFSTGIFTYEPSATISDENGNLLFYTNGAKVWNKNHEIMALGDHLNVGGVGWPLSTITQGVIIIPDPGNDNEYYIFQLDNPVYYSKVNMLNFDGLGSVYLQNEALYDFHRMEKMTAVKHGNGRDWWLIIPAYPEGGSDGYGNPLLYYEFLITPTGIEGPFIKEGFLHENQNIGINRGQMKFNPLGNILAVTHGRSIILYDFNRCSGEITFKYIIDSLFSGDLNDCIYGLEFSPDGSKLYAAKSGGETYGSSRLFQFDINSDSIDETKFTLHQEFTNFHFCTMQLGLDGKIYLTMPNNSNYYTDTLMQNINLSIIHNPDLSKEDCNYEHLGQYIGGAKATYSLPNMPNYNLGVLPKSACDTLNTSISNTEYGNGFTLFPNPTKDAFYIKAKQNTHTFFALLMMNVQGKEVMYLSQYIPGNTIPTAHLPEGLYLVLLSDADVNVLQQKLIISR